LWNRDIQFAVPADEQYTPNRVRMEADAVLAEAALAFGSAM